MITPSWVDLPVGARRLRIKKALIMLILNLILPRNAIHRPLSLHTARRCPRSPSDCIFRHPFIPDLPFLLGEILPSHPLRAPSLPPPSNLHSVGTDKGISCP